MKLKVFIGCDHHGVGFKARIVTLLTSLGHEAVDLGSHEPGVSCDYPQFSLSVASAVADHPGARGILLCMTGIGHSIAANKVPGAYAALCYNREAAVLSRQHNNSNILVLGARFVSEPEMLEIIPLWLDTPFEGGRHQRRFDQIREIENRFIRFNP